MRKKAVLYSLFAALLLPSFAAAQSVETGKWAVNLRGGAILFQEASAINTAPVIGVEALYRFSPRIAVGPSLDFAYARSDGRYFIAVLDFGPDSTRTFEVGQNLSVVHFGANALLNLLSRDRFGAYGALGGGGYAVYLGAQTNNGPQRVTGLQAQAGAGVRYAFSGSTGVQLDARDVIYFGFDRDELNPVRPDQRNVRPDGSIRFPAAEHDLSDESSTLHNVRLTLGFTYVPGASR